MTRRLPLTAAVACALLVPLVSPVSAQSAAAAAPAPAPAPATLSSLRTTQDGPRVDFSFPQASGPLDRVVVRVADGDVAPADPDDGEDLPLRDPSLTYGTVLLSDLASGQVRSASVFGIAADGTSTPPASARLRQPTRTPWPLWNASASGGSSGVSIHASLEQDGASVGSRAACAAGDVAPTAPTAGSEGPGAFVRVRGLAPSTSYTCAAWAVDAAGLLSEEPVVVRATTTAAPPMPYGLSFDHTTPGKLDVYWNDVPWPTRRAAAIRIAYGRVPPPYTVEPGPGADLETRVVWTGSSRYASFSLPTPQDVSLSIFGIDNEDTVGPALTATSYATRFTRTSPGRTVPFGSPVTVSGLLTLLDGTPVPNQDVLLWADLQGSTGFRAVAYGRSNSAGRVSVTWTPTRSGSLQLRLPGTLLVQPSASTAATVPVTARVALRSSAAAVRRGSTVALTGAVAPRPGGTAVVVQRLDGRSWRTVTTVRTVGTGTGSSTFSARVVPPVGTSQYRAVAAAGSGTAGGASGTVVVRSR